jgi:hypothetical protein
MRSCLAIAGLIAMACATPAFGAPKKRPPTPQKLSEAVNLENKRAIALLSFEILSPGKGKSEELLVVRLDKPLAAGQSTSLSLHGAKGCLFEARWKFADLADSGSVDLCTDAHIVLVD